MFILSTFSMFFFFFFNCVGHFFTHHSYVAMAAIIDSLSFRIGEFQFQGFLFFWSLHHNSNTTNIYVNLTFM